MAASTSVGWRPRQHRHLVLQAPAHYRRIQTGAHDVFGACLHGLPGHPCAGHSARAHQKFRHLLRHGRDGGRGRFGAEGHLGGGNAPSTKARARGTAPAASFITTTGMIPIASSAQNNQTCSFLQSFFAVHKGVQFFAGGQAVIVAQTHDLNGADGVSTTHRILQRKPLAQGGKDACSKAVACAHRVHNRFHRETGHVTAGGGACIISALAPPILRSRSLRRALRKLQRCIRACALPRGSRPQPRRAERYRTRRSFGSCNRSFSAGRPTIEGAGWGRRKKAFYFRGLFPAGRRWPRACCRSRREAMPVMCRVS